MAIIKTTEDGWDCVPELKDEVVYAYEEAADQVELSAKIVDVLEKQSEKLEAQNNTGSRPTTKEENN